MLAIRSSFAGSVIVSVAGIGACSASGPTGTAWTTSGTGIWLGPWLMRPT